MLVFYYCWKRGRETRLAKEAEAATADADADDDDEIEIEMTDEADEADDDAEKVDESGDVPEKSAAKHRETMAQEGDAQDLKSGV